MRRTKKVAPLPPLPVEGWPRPYLRDGVPGLTLERQQEILATIAGLDLSDEGKLFVDELSRAKIRARAALPERDNVVNPRHPGETIYVASLRVLGWDSLDVMRAMRVAADHDAKVFCADTGECYSPDSPATEILSGLVRSEEARRRARITPASNASKETRAHRLATGLAIARKEWGRPSHEISVKAIAALCGLSTRTLYHHLPPRTQAQEEALNGKRHV